MPVEVYNRGMTSDLNIEDPVEVHPESTLLAVSKFVGNPGLILLFEGDTDKAAETHTFKTIGTGSTSRYEFRGSWHEDNGEPRVLFEKVAT